MMPPAARVRALAALVIDAAETHGRALHPQGAHAAVSRLLEEGRTPAAILAAAAVDAADPDTTGGPRWPARRDAWNTAPPQRDPARCRVCGQTMHRCARLASVVAPSARHPFTPAGATTDTTTDTTTRPQGPPPPGRPCADCSRLITTPNRVRCPACAAATFTERPCP